MKRKSLPADLSARFEALGPLGNGATGEVLLARGRTPGRLVALKLIETTERALDALARFKREASELARLVHPGIVRLYDAGVAEGAPYLVLERLEGEVLESAMRAGPWLAGRVAALLDASLAALACVHGRHLVHRDLKPSNVFLRTGGAPVLIDFGLVRAPDHTLQTQAGTLMGTPRYLAPELITGAGHAPASDLFARALTALEVLTHADVHATEGEGSDLATLLSSLSSGAYLAAAASVLKPHGRLGDVLLRALAPDPADRWPDADTMREALFRRDASAPTVGRLPSKPAGTRRVQRSHAVIAALAVSVAVVLCALRAVRPAPVRVPPAPPASVRTASDRSEVTSIQAEARRLGLDTLELSRRVGADSNVVPEGFESILASATALLEGYTRLVRRADERSGPPDDAILVLERTGFQILEQVSHVMRASVLTATLSTRVRGVAGVRDALAALRHRFNRACDPHVRLAALTPGPQVAILDRLVERR